jgi:hypothetical protein
MARSNFHQLWDAAIVLVLVLLVVLGCAQTPSTPISPTPAETPTPALTPTPTPTTPPDTTPPSAITGLVANNAYDGKVNLWWDKTAATDFDHYNVYLDKTDMADITGMRATQQIKDIATCRYQATGLEDGTRCYFAVTAVDKSDNESTKVTNVSAMPTPMPKGTKDPDIVVDVYNSEMTWAGTTLLRDSHNPGKHRIIEVNMLGEIVWQYMVPQNLGGAGDVELLPNNNILFTANGGVYEIDRSGKVVWQYLTSKIDHDADRLPNGNTIFVFGMSDQKSDAQVTEVNPKGEIVWQWYARDYFDRPPYNSIYEEGSWTHANAVTRMPNGNTFISLRNFSMVVEVDPKGAVVRTIGEGVLVEVHDPEILPNGDILGALPVVTNPAHAIEIDPKSGSVVWQFRWPRELLPQGTRDTNRLPNGNTLVVGGTKMVEVTSSGEIVWQLGLKGISFSSDNEAKSSGFYKADRISAQR